MAISPDPVPGADWGTPLAAGFRHRVAQHAVIDMTGHGELVIGQPGELREMRWATDSATIMRVASPRSLACVCRRPCCAGLELPRGPRKPSRMREMTTTLHRWCRQSRSPGDNKAARR
jgi:hypothetical protein